MQKAFYLLFFVVFLEATVTTPFELLLSTGYRQDHLKWRLQEPGDASTTTYREKYSNLKFLESEVTIKKITRNVYLYLNGGYGAYGTNKMNQSGFDFDFTNAPVSFLFDTDGEAFDGTTFLGYIAQLTPDRFYEVNITPLFGFSIHYEQIKRKTPTPNPFTSSDIDTANFFTVSSTLSGKNLKQKWYGIFIGFDIYAHPRGIFCFSAGYRYHWLSMHQNFFSDTQIKTFNANSMILLDQVINMHGTVRKNGNLGHSGYLNICAQPNRYISFNAIGKVYYFSSHVINMDVTEQIVEFMPNPGITNTKFNRKFKSRWFFYNILFGISFSI